MLLKGVDTKVCREQTQRIPDSVCRPGRRSSKPQKKRDIFLVSKIWVFSSVQFFVASRWINVVASKIDTFQQLYNLPHRCISSREEAESCGVDERSAISTYPRK